MKGLSQQALRPCYKIIWYNQDFSIATSIKVSVSLTKLFLDS